MERGESRRAVGASYEQKAADYLKRLGYQILDRNYVSRYGELDLVTRDGAYLVFVEVKYRRDQRGGHPLEAVTPKKHRRICKTAAVYCLHRGYGDGFPCRFDVIGVLGDEIFHIKNAFLYSE